MELNLTDKLAVVTGGAQGIGEGIARMLLAEGARVVIADIDAIRAQRTLADMGSRAGFEHMDVTDHEAVRKAVEAISKQHGEIDILVNNAGIGNKAPFARMTPENFNNVFRVNVYGTFNVTQAVIAKMAHRKAGKIVNIAALAGVDPRPLYAHYSASKAAVIAFTKSVALEYAESNLNINCICPGAVDTKLWTQPVSDELCGGDLSVGGCQGRTFSLGRAQKIEDIAHMVCYLSSDLAKNVTGQNFFITS